MTEQTDRATSALPKTIQTRHFAALAFGSIVGSAWVMVLGDWLNIAGPAGSAAGFLAGGVVMAIVAASYAELCSRFPVAGAEIVYTFEVYGPRVGFAVGWFSVLFFLSGGAFESIAISTLLAALFPASHGPVLYHVLGQSITSGSLLTGFLCGWMLIWLNWRGSASTARLQLVLTAVFICFALVVIFVGFGWGKWSNSYPLFVTGNGQAWQRGALWIFATCPFWLNGFQAVPQAIEERALGVTFQKLAMVMIGSIGAATLFYICITCAVSMAQPWQRSIGQPLATAAAMDALVPGGWLRRFVITAAILSLLKTWNGITLTTARLLLALGRASYVPVAFSRLHSRYRSPYAALLLIGVVNSVAVIIGRGVVLPIVNTASMAVAFSFFLCCGAVWLLRRRGAHVANISFRVPGGYWLLAVGVVGIFFMAAFAIIDPAIEAWPHLALEWKLLMLWSFLGATFAWIGRAHRRSLSVTQIRDRFLAPMNDTEGLAEL